MPEEDKSPHYLQRTEIVKVKRDQSKLKRFAGGMKKFMEWKVNDPKKSRVEA